MSDGWNITCAKCDQVSPMSSWVWSPVGGDLPFNEFQCPVCKVRVRKEFGKPEIWDNGEELRAVYRDIKIVEISQPVKVGP